MSDEEIEAVRMAANNAGDDVVVKLCTQVLERRGQQRQRLIDVVKILLAMEEEE